MSDRGRPQEGFAASDMFRYCEKLGTPIIKVTDYEAAVRFINARPKPLALYFFACDQKLIRRFLREVPAGGVCVNDTISHLVSANCLSAAWAPEDGDVDSKTT